MGLGERMGEVAVCAFTIAGVAVARAGCHAAGSGGGMDGAEAFAPSNRSPAGFRGPVIGGADPHMDRAAEPHPLNRAFIRPAGR